MPKENVLKFIWGDGSWIAVRPSGTEPKIKVYYSIRDKSRENAGVRLANVKKLIADTVNKRGLIWKNMFRRCFSPNFRATAAG